VGAVTSLLLWALAPAVVDSMRLEPAPAALAVDYLRALAWGYPTLVIFTVLEAVFRGAGDTRTPMLIAVFANILNVAGNYVLIFGKFGAPEMGVAGAGLSTAIALAVQGILVTAWMFTPGSALRLRASSFRSISRESVRRLVRLTLPAAVDPLVLRTGFLVFLALMKDLGKSAMAAHRGAIAGESLSFMPGWGFSIACGAMIGQCLGARRPDRAAAGFRESAILATMVMSVLGLAFAIVPGYLIRFFIPSAPVVEQAGAACLRLGAVEQPLMALAMVFGGALRGAGDTRSPILVAVLGVWCVRIPLSYFFAFTLGWGIAGAWFVMILDWGTRAAVFAYVWRRGAWKNLRL
jgi:putative MATE family efflux protein